MNHTDSHKEKPDRRELKTDNLDQGQITQRYNGNTLQYMSTNIQVQYFQLQ